MGDAAGAAGPSSRISRLRVAGAWSGSLDVPLDDWSVGNLCSEVSHQSGISLDSIKLICAGRILKEDGAGPSKTLREVGLGDNSKLLLTRVNVHQTNSANAEQERAERLARIKAAVDAMAKRSNEDEYMSDNFDLQLENQSGDKVTYSDTDRRALVMGLMLHAKARSLLEQSNYNEALEVLAMAEEAFSLCDSKILEAVDNVALLQIDTVWCLFMLRDIERLAVARERLARARDGLCRSHGRNLERLRVLQGGFCPELALYVRLELLEGIVAYYSGQPDSARESLISAQRKFQQLQVSDEAMASLASMGFSMTECRRALRVSGQDTTRAVEFVMTERNKAEEKAKEDRRRQRERREQKRYGKTAGGKAVDISKLGEIASIGFERRIAAEALKQSENNMDLALEMLMDPCSSATLQVCMGGQQSRGPVDSIALAELMSMGFSKTKGSFSSNPAVGSFELLSKMSKQKLKQEHSLNTTPTSDRKNAKSALQGSDDTAQALDRLIQGLQGSNAEPEESASSPVDPSAADQDESSLPESPASMDLDPRDEEMEQEIARNLTGDPLAEYDIEVGKEGDAIAEYLALLNSNAPLSST